MVAAASDSPSNPLHQQDQNAAAAEEEDSMFSEDGADDVAGLSRSDEDREAHIRGILSHQTTADLMEVDSEVGGLFRERDDEDLGTSSAPRSRLRRRPSGRRATAADDDANVLDEENEVEDDEGADAGEDAAAATGLHAAAVAAKDSDLSSSAAPTTVRQDEALVDSKYIADLFPDLAAEYKAAGSANRVPVDEVRADSAVVASWRCPHCSNVWPCAVFIRCVLKNACPTCDAARHPSVASKRPDLAQLWDVTRNDPFLTPEECPADSTKTVHWLCPTCSTSFPARVKDRVAGKALCPSCALMHMQSAEVLAQEESALLQEWHPLKNGDLCFDLVQPTDNKTKLWWLCSLCGHDWQATLASRLSRRRSTKGSVCPACHGKGVG